MTHEEMLDRTAKLVGVARDYGETGKFYTLSYEGSKEILDENGRLDFAKQ